MPGAGERIAAFGTGELLSDIPARTAAPIHVEFNCGGWILSGHGRRLLALDEGAAHRAYQYLLNLDTARACRAVGVARAAA